MIWPAPGWPTEVIAEDGIKETHIVNLTTAGH